MLSLLTSLVQTGKSFSALPLMPEDDRLPIARSVHFPMINQEDAVLKGQMLNKIPYFLPLSTACLLQTLCW